MKIGIIGAGNIGGNLTRRLTALGHEVSVAASAAELDRILERTSIDLVILDLNMPGEKGLEVLRRLRRSGATPVLILSAKHTVDDRVRGLFSLRK